MSSAAIASSKSSGVGDSPNDADPKRKATKAAEIGRIKSAGWSARFWVGRRFECAPAQKIAAHDKVFVSVKSKSCAGSEGTRESSRIAPPMVVVVVFRIAGMRGGAKRGPHGDRVVSDVATDGSRERTSAEVRRSETPAVRKSAARHRVPTDSAAMAAAASTASVRTAAPCGTGASAAAGSRRACRNGCA